MHRTEPLIFKRPAWWYLVSGLMLLLVGGALLFLFFSGPLHKPGAKPVLFLLGSASLLAAAAFFRFRCRTVIDFARNRVSYEWSTFFVGHHEVHALNDIQHVGVRSATTPNPGIFTHHVFLSIEKAGRSTRIELQEIVYHDKAVERGREVAQMLGKPFVDCSNTA